MTELDRRSFLKTGAAVAASTAVVGGPFQGLVAGPARAADVGAPALVPVADLRDGDVRLHLPPGFQYRSFHDNEYGATLTDGTVIPGRHDGMGAFAGPGDLITLVRNHEIPGVVNAFKNDGTTYDAKTGGGTTTTVVNKFGEVESSRASLSGTQSNCSGGVMPWGSWISCEETVNGPDVADDFTRNQANNPPGDVAKPDGSDPFEYFQNPGLLERHGYIFEVPADGASTGEPITSAGRFSHESVAYDPRNNDLYLTEDNFGFPSGFYRYRPSKRADKNGRLDNKGQLQMLAVKHQSNANLAADQPAGATYEVEWVNIDQPDFDAGSPVNGVPRMSNDEAITYVGRQGFGAKKGAAYFSRLEGAVHDNGMIFFTSTQGGGPAETQFDTTVVGGFGNGTGQVWAYDVQAKRLRLVYQSPGANVLDFPDNITTSRRGTLVLCEDNVNDNYMRGLTQQGQIGDIAVNRLLGRPNAAGVRVNRFNDEFAGSTFSPDGHTLFVNIQASRGMTFAIWGDWASIGV
jgi:secreted PhoX family phosphatase